MDFVDLDKVLDEFEEEEKAALSIVPGEELKPSGYIEFLEKHENQTWESVTTDVSNPMHSLGSNNSDVSSLREAVNVSYDEPYDCYTPSKLDSVQDRSLSPSVSHVDQLVITGERVRGLKDLVENRSKRGTIASKTSEVQTDALSPTTERELSSLPFPKSDIIVEGHENAFAHDENTSLIKNHQDQNNSPIYASVDSSRLFSSSSDNTSIITSNTSSVQSGFLTENKHSFSQFACGTGSQTGHALSAQRTGVIAEPVIGFQDLNDRDVDENELNVYLNEIEREDLLGVSNSHVNIDVKSDSNLHSLQSVISPENDLNIAVRDQDLKINNASTTEVQTNDREASDCGEMGINESDIQCKDKGVTGLIQQDQSRVYDSLINGKTVIEDILEEKKNMNEIESSSSAEKKGNSAIYEQLMFGKMEIENLLNEAVKNQQEKMLKYSAGNNSSFSLDSKPTGDKISSDLTLPNNLGCDLKMVNGIDSNENLPFVMNNIEERELKPSSMNVLGESPVYTGIGARPKDPSVLKKNRPSSLVGLSKINLDMPSPSKNYEDNSVLLQGKPAGDLSSQSMLTESVAQRVYNDHEAGLAHENTQRMNHNSDDIASSSIVPPVNNLYDESHHDGEDSFVKCQPGDEDTPNGSDDMKKMSRPTTLNLPSRPDFDMAGEEGDEAKDQNTDSQMTEQGGQEVASAPPAADLPPILDDFNLQSEAASAAEPPRQIPQRNLGEVAPFWVPDTDAEACMTCGIKFTLWKRRHHCRACGKVLCSQCCSQKSFLRYMDNKEARVCVECYLDLNVAPSFESSPRSPNPNNPSEYCSKIPPNQQATNQGVPPTVMVPSGVLKSSVRNRRSEPKQVMFSDGIRPGGDLTELDGEDHTRSHRRSSRAARKAAQQQSQNSAKKLKSDSLSRSPCLVPANGLPPLFILDGDKGHVEMDEALNQLDYTDDYKMEGGPSISYAVNKNLSVAVKVVNLDCCMNRVCWSYVSRGMSSVGQRELIILLELTEEEASSPSIKPPRDVFMHFHYLYEEALKGFTIQDMGHTILHQSFLGSRDHGGFLYVQPTFQCLNKLTLPETPFAFGILLQKWEAPWAKVFPIRLMLRLGAEFRYYPCPLISVRNRKPVFYEIGHTIMNLLADFRNFQYSLSQIRGVTIHMEDKKTVISLPKNRYNDIMKVVRSSNEHVMAFGSSFSCVADSHLVCIQNEEGNYQTQAINIQNKPRQVTGASFVVFNGALKTSSGLRAKSSIVEDGVMVQVLPDAMAMVKQVLKDMTDHTIPCGPVDAAEPDEVLEIHWVDNDKAFNIGVKSYIDGISLEGVESVSVKSTSDFVGKDLAIRWTRVYFLRQDNSSSNHFDPVDLTRLTEEIAQASCTALVPHLEELRELEQAKIGLRVNLTRDAVGYEIGSKGQGLPEKILTGLDTCLIPIIHQACEEGMILELVFHILE